MAATPWQRWRLQWPLCWASAGLVLSGAPAMAVLLGTGGVAGPACSTATPLHTRSAAALGPVHGCWPLLVAALAWALDLWRWRLGLPRMPQGKDWRSLGRLLLWFTWPAWPLALWTLWRWRRQLMPPSRHVALPLWFAAGFDLAATLTTPRPTVRCCWAAGAGGAGGVCLPTLQRSVAALIDWFTLLFFSGCALAIWVVWIAMQTGVPAKPAANVAKLAPGLSPLFAGRLCSGAGATLAGPGWSSGARAPPRRHLEKPGAARRRRRPVLAAADDAVAAAAGLCAQLQEGGLDVTRAPRARPSAWRCMA
jgi:hypothetical protein